MNFKLLIKALLAIAILAIITAEIPSISFYSERILYLLIGAFTVLIFPNTFMNKKNDK